jgi:hypothetical protein
MKSALVIAAVFAGGLYSSFAFGETCTAPNHPSCSVSCVDGCGAVWREPKGPCSTLCEPESPGGGHPFETAAPRSGTSAQFKGLSSSHIQELLDKAK